MDSLGASFGPTFGVFVVLQIFDQAASQSCAPCFRIFAFRSHLNGPFHKGRAVWARTLPMGWSCPLVFATWKWGIKKKISVSSGLAADRVNHSRLKIDYHLESIMNLNFTASPQAGLFALLFTG